MSFKFFVEIMLSNIVRETIIRTNAEASQHAKERLTLTDF